ncbi:hypothetical protein [Jiella mangrovi]|uniref:Lipocalin-like domain-containing protein n=1 Tax=Jiella mangrovi TaxID=2821407 RepID=A0ABS4BL28_9HYPH|nr:hypothetical protein [Jiella mangrovi]MBP0617428.1 hypothetical protein [Jiella mangrovi]
MAVLSAFEILAETLVPDGLLPPGASNPVIIQGYWVQISVAQGYSSANFNLIFQETTDFDQGIGKKALNAQIIDAKGEANVYPQSSFFASTGRGFLGQTIVANQTLIFGVQALPFSRGEELAAIPQNGTGWRGTVRIEGQQPGSLIATPTQRLIYYRQKDTTFSDFVDATVYPVPTVSGTTQI